MLRLASTPLTLLAARISRTSRISISALSRAHKQIAQQITQHEYELSTQTSHATNRLIPQPIESPSDLQGGLVAARLTVAPPDAAINFLVNSSEARVELKP